MENKPIVWEPFSKGQSHFVYAVPFEAHGIHYCKIGAGSSDRPLTIQSALRSRGFTVDGALYIAKIGNTYVRVEDYLHKFFRYHRVDPITTNWPRFDGYTECFRISIDEVLNVTEWMSLSCFIYLPDPQLSIVPLEGKEGCIQVELGERLSWEKVILGDFILGKLGVFTDIQEVNTVFINWFTFIGDEPFKLLGGYERGTPNYKQVSKTLMELEDKLNKYIGQWAISSEDATTLKALVVAGLSFYGLVKYLKSSGIKQYDDGSKHSVLDTL